MAKYDYKCTKCGHEMLNYRKGMNDPKPQCEKCNEDVEIVFNTSAKIGDTGFCQSRPSLKDF